MHNCYGTFSREALENRTVRSAGYRLSHKSAGDNTVHFPGSRGIQDPEKMDLAAASVYAILRSNGKTVTFDEALQLVPMDDEQIRVLLEGFSARCDEYAKKKRARQQMAKGLT